MSETDSIYEIPDWFIKRTIPKLLSGEEDDSMRNGGGISMEDRFKFRAWLKDYKMMVEVARIDDDGSIEARLSEDSDYLEFWPHEFELMQCTGLKDKNGRLMFEGDVVKMISQDNRGVDYDEMLTIEWSKDVCGFVGMNAGLKQDGMYAPLTSHDKIEVLEINVIGNVYDNPELLEGSKDERD